MKFKGVIFDLDGVICFTDKFHYQAWKKLADRLGIEFDEKINDRLRGVSRMASLEIILEKSARAYSDAEKESFAAEKNDAYRALLENMGKSDVSEEVRDTLSELRARGVLLAIGSSSRNTPLILEKTGMKQYFDAVSDGNNITRSKPDPEVFLKAAEKLGESPSNCAVVEDSMSGIIAAKAGGFYAVAISDAKKSPIADLRIEKLSNILH